MMKWKVTRNSRSSSADRPLGRFVESGLNDVSPRQAIPDQSRSSSSQRMHENITPPNRKHQQVKSHRLSRKDSFAASDCIPINLKDILGITRQRTESTISNSSSILFDRRRSRSEVRFSSTDRLTLAYHAYPVSASPQQYHAESRQQRPASVPKNRCPSPPGKSSGWLRGRKRERMNRKPTLGVCHGVTKNEASYKSNNNQNHRPIHDLRVKDVLIKDHVLSGKSVMEGSNGRRNIEQVMKNKNEMNLTFPCLDVNFPNKSKGGSLYPDSHEPNTKTCGETARFRRQKGYAPQPERRKSLQQKEEKHSGLRMILPSCPSPNRKSTESFKTNVMDVSMIATTGCDNPDKAFYAESITKTKSDNIVGGKVANEEETNEDHDATASASIFGKSDSEKYDENNGIGYLKIDFVEHPKLDSNIDGALTNGKNGEETNSMDTEYSEMTNEEECFSEIGNYEKENGKFPVAEYLHCDANENSPSVSADQNFEEERNPLRLCDNETKMKQEDGNKESRSMEGDETKNKELNEIKERKSEELDQIKEKKSEEFDKIKVIKSKRTDEMKQKRNKRSNEIKERKTKRVEEINETSFAKLHVNDCKHPIVNNNPRHVSKDKNNNTREVPQKQKRSRYKPSKDSASLRNKNKISIRVTDKENIVDISEQVAPKSHCTQVSSNLIRDSGKPKSVSSGDEGQSVDKELSGDIMNGRIPALESSTCPSGQEPLENTEDSTKELVASQECTFKLRPKSTPPAPPPRNKMTAHQEMTVSVVIRNPPSVDKNDVTFVNSEVPDCSPETLVMKKSFVLTIAKQEMGFRSMCAGKEISYKIESCRNKEHQISVSFLCSGGGTKKPLLERQASMSPIADMRLRSISMPPFNRGQHGDLVPVPPPRGGFREGRSRDRQSSKKRRKKDSEFHMPKAVIDELSQVLERRKRSPDDDSD